MHTISFYHTVVRHQTKRSTHPISNDNKTTKTTKTKTKTTKTTKQQQNNNNNNSSSNKITTAAAAATAASATSTAATSTSTLTAYLVGAVSLLPTGHVVHANAGVAAPLNEGAVFASRHQILAIGR